MAKKAKRELDQKNNECMYNSVCYFPIMGTLVIDSAGKKHSHYLGFAYFLKSFLVQQEVIIRF